MLKNFSNLSCIDLANVKREPVFHLQLFITLTLVRQHTITISHKQSYCSHRCADDDTLIILAGSPCLICGRRRLVSRKWPKWLVPIWSSKPSEVSSYFWQMTPDQPKQIKTKFVFENLIWSYDNFSIYSNCPFNVFVMLRFWNFIIDNH